MTDRQGAGKHGGAAGVGVGAGPEPGACATFGHLASAADDARVGAALVGRADLKRGTAQLYAARADHQGHRLVEIVQRPLAGPRAHVHHRHGRELVGAGQRQRTGLNPGLARVALHRAQRKHARALFDQARLAGAVLNHAVKAEVVTGASAHTHNDLAAAAGRRVGDRAFTQQAMDGDGAAVHVQCAAAVELHISAGADLGIARAAQAQGAAVAHLNSGHSQAAPQGIDGRVVVGLVQQQHAAFDHRAPAVADRAAQGQGARAFLEQLAIASQVERARARCAESAAEGGVCVVGADPENGARQCQCASASQ